jgi:hypothetical protein
MNVDKPRAVEWVNRNALALDAAGAAWSAMRRENASDSFDALLQGQSMCQSKDDMHQPDGLSAAMVKLACRCSLVSGAAATVCAEVCKLKKRLNEMDDAHMNRPVALLACRHRG